MNKKANPFSTELLEATHGRTPILDGQPLSHEHEIIVKAFIRGLYITDSDILNSMEYQINTR